MNELWIFYYQKKKEIIIIEDYYIFTNSNSSKEYWLRCVKAWKNDQRLLF